MRGQVLSMDLRERGLYTIKTDSPLKVGDNISIKVGEVRSAAQNRTYWLFLNWLIDNGLRDHGHFSAEGLHENLKAHFIAEGILTGRELTTTQLTKKEFQEYLENISVFMGEFFQIDTSPFWELQEKVRSERENDLTDF